MKRTRRRALVLLTAMAPLTAISACGFASDVGTMRPQNVSDGVNAELGGVDAQALVVVGTEGQEGLLSGALVNDGTSSQTVTVTAEGSPQPVPVEVPAGQIVTLGGQGSDATVNLGELKTIAGSVVPVRISSPTGGQVEVRVPVLAPDLYYSTVTPTAN